MQTFYALEDYVPAEPLALTQGTFDGLHKGHVQIINKLKNEAQSKNLKTAVLTFFPHPRMVIHQNKDTIKLLDTVKEKIQHFEKTGIDFLFILPFTDELAETSPQDYISDFLVKKLNVKLLVVGYDHRFGKDRKGDISTLRDKTITPFEVHELHAQLLDEIAISSTKIRNALHQGDITLANQYLGYSYHINGTVAHGHKKGKDLGFPTANIQVAEDYKLIPADGIYAVRVELENKMFNGVVNIGNQPTFAGRKYAIEVHIFDFNMDIYAKRIKLLFIERLRGEKRFDSVDELIFQIGEDVKLAKNILLKK